MTFLDYNATAPMRPEAIAAMTEALALPLNASSVHRQGRQAKQRLEAARRALAERISCFTGEIAFTGSATEANNMLLRAFAGGRILTSAIEHASVMKAAEAERVPVTAEGVIDLEALERMLMEGPHPSPLPEGAIKPSPPGRGLGEGLSSTTGPTLVSLMLANNETGVVQPVREAAAIAHRHGALIHCDAVQALGKIPIDLGLLGADFMTLGAHKMGGPVGIGALVVRQGLDVPAHLLGGGQEKGRRAGTENIAALAGWQAALEARDDWTARNRAWHRDLESRLKAAAPGMRVIGESARRLPNCSSLLMPGVAAETQLMHFDLSGFSVSAGSACSSGRIEASHVLRAMGVPEEAGGVIRISSGWATTENEMTAFAEAWQELYRRLKK